VSTQIPRRIRPKRKSARSYYGPRSRRSGRRSITRWRSAGPLESSLPGTKRIAPLVGILGASSRVSSTGLRPRLGSGKSVVNNRADADMVIRVTIVQTVIAVEGAVAGGAAGTAGGHPTVGVVAPAAAMEGIATAATATATAAAATPRPLRVLARTLPLTIRSRKKRRAATKIAPPPVGPRSLRKSLRASRAVARAVIRAVAPAHPRGHRRTLKASKKRAKARCGSRSRSRSSSPSSKDAVARMAAMCDTTN
jgi:hypothetical protein